MSNRLEVIDRLIERHGLLGRRCLTKRQRSRCMCGHITSVHVSDVGHCRGQAPSRNRTTAGRTLCPCLGYQPYDYAKETQARLKKLRMFALDIMEAANQ